VRLLHARRAVDAVFDEANLVSCAGLVPVMGLAEQVDLAGLVGARVRPDLSTGSNPGGKAAAVVAGTAAGADSIDDLDVLRHGGMATLFAGVYAPSTLGSFLRFFTWGHALQLEAAARDLLVMTAPFAKDRRGAPAPARAPGWSMTMTTSRTAAAGSGGRHGGAAEHRQSRQAGTAHGGNARAGGATRGHAQRAGRAGRKLRARAADEQQSTAGHDVGEVPATRFAAQVVDEIDDRVDDRIGFRR
jgi:hypothetical protein